MARRCAECLALTEPCLSCMHNNCSGCVLASQAYILNFPLDFDPCASCLPCLTRLFAVVNDHPSQFGIPEGTQAGQCLLCELRLDLIIFKGKKRRIRHVHFQTHIQSFQAYTSSSIIPKTFAPIATSGSSRGHKNSWPWRNSETNFAVCSHPARYCVLQLRTDSTAKWKALLEPFQSLFTPMAFRHR